MCLQISGGSALAAPIFLSEKHIEKVLSRAGARIAEATEKALTANELCKDSGRLLMDAQSDIAELYEYYMPLPLSRHRSIKPLLVLPFWRFCLPYYSLLRRI